MRYGETMSDDEQWTSCPTGTLRRLQGQFANEAHRRTLNPYLVGAGLAFLVAAMLFGFSLVKSEPTAPLPIGRLACHQVLPLLQAYHDGSLEAGVRQQVVDHLAYCGACQQAYETKFANAAVPRGRLPRASRSRLLLSAAVR